MDMERFNFPFKIKLVIVFLSSLATAYLAFAYSDPEEEQMNLLYENVLGNEAMGIAANLRSKGMKVEFREEGQAIYVNSDIVHVLRFQLSQEGLAPRSAKVSEQRSLTK